MNNTSAVEANNQAVSPELMDEASTSVGLLIGAATTGSADAALELAAAGSTIIGAVNNGGVVSAVGASLFAATGGAVSGGAGCAEAIFRHQPKTRMATAIEADVERMAIETPSLT